jgi:hypothetical protein
MTFAVVGKGGSIQTRGASFIATVIDGTKLEKFVFSRVFFLKDFGLDL